MPIKDRWPVLTRLIIVIAWYTLYWVDRIASGILPVVFVCLQDAYIVLAR